MANNNTSERKYEDFAPISDLLSEKECDTLLLYLPGFRKEQLRVQLTTSRILRISGERQIGDNTWKRFHKEFQVPTNIDMKEMTAKFEGGILYIRQPKLITPETNELQHDQGETTAEPPAPQPQQEDPNTDGKMEKKDGKQEDEVEKKEEKQEPQMERKEEGEITAGDNEERRRKHRLDELHKVGSGSELFKELRKPEKQKRLAVYVILLLVLGFNIFKMFKSFTKVEDQSLLEYNHQEF